jgi:CheY-like chemotaxis protein
MTALHTVLVVDDDADIRDTIVDLLQDHGYRAIPAQNGANALEVLQSVDQPPCLILLDLMMPVMDGATFRTEQLKNPQWATIPVVLMSAYRDVADQASSLAVDHLAKPLGADRLIATTRRYCSLEADS